MVISRGAGEERRLFPPWGLGTFPAHNTLNKEEGMSFISQYSLYKAEQDIYRFIPRHSTNICLVTVMGYG